MSLQLVPKSGMLLVRPIASKLPQSGTIQLADWYEKPQTTGEVIGMAERFTCTECGSSHEPQVEEGDVILFPPSAGNLVEFGGEPLLLIREDDVLAVVNEGVEAEVV
jgi:co-chaperonin GroES (HSP10)